MIFKKCNHEWKITHEEYLYKREEEEPYKIIRTVTCLKCNKEKTKSFINKGKKRCVKIVNQ